MTRTIVILQVLLFLVPASLACLGGVISLFLMFSGGDFPTHLDYRVAFALMVLAFGYALFSLWWLVIRYRSVTPGKIPKAIRIGVMLGTIVSGLFYISFSLTLTRGMSISESISIDQGVPLLLATLVLAGPICLLVTLLMTIHRRRTQ